MRRHKELKEFKKKFDADVERAHDEFIREVDTRGEEVASISGMLLWRISEFLEVRSTQVESSKKCNSIIHYVIH